MAFNTSNYGSYATYVAANSDIKAKLWSKKVVLDARRKNALREMVGDGEETNMPIRRVTDLSKGGSQEVVMTTMAGIGGQGTLGENELRTRTAKPRVNTWTIKVDLLRHATSITQVVKKLRFGDIDAHTAVLMGDWLKQKEEDDLQVCARRTCVLLAPNTNLFYGGDATSLATLESADVMTTTVLDKGKSLLTGLGAKEIGFDKDISGSEILKYLAFAPDAVASSMRSNTAWLQAIREADSRGPENRLFSGKYGLWNNTALYVHNLVSHTALGRLGSPLLAHAFLGTAIPSNVATTLTGGGTAAPADATAENDFFANFPGYLWKFTDDETAPADSGTHYAMICNLPGSTDAGKYEIVSYTTGNNGATITSVTRGTTSNFNGNAIAEAAGRFSNVHDSGSLIIPCTVNGVPFGDVLFFGGAGIGWAIGSDDAVKIENGEDFYVAGTKQWHVTSHGLQSIRGFSPRKDTNGRYPGVCMARVAVNHPLFAPEPYVAT